MLSEYKSFVRCFKCVYEIMIVEVELEVGLILKEVIWKKNKVKLYCYMLVKDNLYKILILFVYVLINKLYILDLIFGNSFVEYLLNCGFDVYLFDWGILGFEDSNMKLDDYIVDYILKVVKKVLCIFKFFDLFVFGYCMGGIMIFIFVVLNEDLLIKNLIFMISLFDFLDIGLYGVFLDDCYFNLDKVVDIFGNIFSEMIDFGNKMLKLIMNFYGLYVMLVDCLEN